MIEISEHFPRTGRLGKRYPRVFQAESLQDMQEGRAQQARGLRSRAGIIPNTNFGSQPYGLDTRNELKAIIFLPEVQHYPAMDPQDDIKRLYGLTLHENLAMRLRDNTGSINVWCHQHSFLDMPYRTCFDEVIFGNAIFSKDKWKVWRDISWRRQVVLLTQYSETSGSIFGELLRDFKSFGDQDRPITEYYWLLHIFDPDGEVIKRRVRREVMIPEGIPAPVFG